MLSPVDTETEVHWRKDGVRCVPRLVPFDFSLSEEFQQFVGAVSAVSLAIRADQTGYDNCGQVIINPFKTSGVVFRAQSNEKRNKITWQEEIRLLPSVGQVEIKVHHVGLNFRDVLIFKGVSTKDLLPANLALCTWQTYKNLSYKSLFHVNYYCFFEHSRQI